MEYPNSWSLQSRRKQPSLYDEYLTKERLQVPSSPLATENSSNSLANHNDGLTIRTVSLADSNIDDASFQPSSTRSFERDYLPHSATSTSPSPILEAPRFERPRRTVFRSESADGRIRTLPQAAVKRDHDHSTVRESRQQHNRPSTRDSAKNSSPAPSPTASSFASAMASKIGKRRFGSVSSADFYSSPTSFAQKTPATAVSHLPTSVSHSVLQPDRSMSRFPTPTSSSWQSASGKSSISALTQILRPSTADSDSAPATNKLLPSNNTRRVLHLMKTLNGCMSGDLMYRRESAQPWISAHCFINQKAGTLMAETEGGASPHRCLVADIRGCEVRCQIDYDTKTPYLILTSPVCADEVHLNVASQSDLDSWFAALLCWQPLRRKGLRNKVAKPHSAALLPRPLDKSRVESDPSASKESPIIKVGRMVYFDDSVSFGNVNLQTSKATPFERIVGQASKAHGARRWRRVSCTLRESGEFKLFTEMDNEVVTVVQLAQLRRCAIQRLETSVLDSAHSIIIYPQYTSTNSPPGTTIAKPVTLIFDSRVIWEVWFVLLRAFTVPELYGPPDHGDNPEKTTPAAVHNSEDAQTRLARMEHTLSIRVNDVRIAAPISPRLQGAAGGSPNLSSVDQPVGHYVELHIDCDLRAKTSIRNDGLMPSWRQDFDFPDLPAVLSSVTVLLKYRPPDSYQGLYSLPHYHDAYGVLVHPQSTTADSGHVGVFRDQVVGRAEITLGDTSLRGDTERSWPLLDMQDQKVGEVSLRIKVEESVILMQEVYENLSKMLHKFETGLTVHMSLTIPLETKRLSDVLVNIFQASGRISDWLMALVEDEIDGINTDSALSRARYGVTPPGNTPTDTERFNSREMTLRDMNKNAALEANLLFRGNTLLTKSLDTHMRRVGMEYLVSAIGQIIHDINEADPDCEVDPNRVTNANDLSRNWTKLIVNTEAVWAAISASAEDCPISLKLIFRHVRACAEDKYGDFLRSIQYSSVSGFLFLRFFCPAVLNPKLFGLLKSDPQPRARRTLTLIAKSLQTLANMATFGSKEHWMEPMNAFLTSHRTPFKDYIDQVCFLRHEPTASGPENLPSYSTPNAIKARLPSAGTEGYLSLPYLLDSTRDLAVLVDLWLHALATRRKGSVTKPVEEAPAIQGLHVVCKGLRQQADECICAAEDAEYPGPEHNTRWEELVDTLQASTVIAHSRLSQEADYTTHPAHVQEAQEKESSDAMGGLRISGSGLDSLSGGVPGVRTSVVVQDWMTAPDGGAAAAAASLISEDRSPRSGFVLSSPVLPSISSPVSPAVTTFPTNTAADLSTTPPMSALAGLMSAPSSRPGSSLSMRAGSKLRKSRSGPNSDTEEAAMTASILSNNSQRDKSPRRERAATRDKDRSHKDGSSTREREVEKQRIKDLVNGFAFGRRRAAEKAAAEKANAEKVLAEVAD